MLPLSDNKYYIVLLVFTARKPSLNSLSNLMPGVLELQFLMSH